MARSDFKSAGAAAADGLPTSGSAEGLWLDVSTTSALGSCEARAGGGGGGAAAVAVRDAEHQLPRRRIALRNSQTPYATYAAGSGAPRPRGADGRLPGCVARHRIAEKKRLRASARRWRHATSWRTDAWELEGRNAYRQAYGECRQAMDGELACLGCYTVVKVAHALHAAGAGQGRAVLTR